MVRSSKNSELCVPVAVVAEHKAMLAEWQRVVASHSKEIDEYIATHGPLTRTEVIDRALTKLLSEV